MSTFAFHLLLGLMLALFFADVSTAKSNPVVHAISRADPYIPPSETGAGESHFLAISLNGQFVVFPSSANNLMTNHYNGRYLGLFHTKMANL